MIGVISDGSALPEQDRLELALLSQARWLKGHGSLDAVTAVVASADKVLPDVLAAECGGTPVYFLVFTQADRAWPLRQSLEAAGNAVITDGDVRATLATAHMLTALRERGQPVDRAAVVIAGSDEIFELGPLLTSVGALSLTFWRDADATAFPLARVAQEADVLVDARAHRTQVRWEPGRPGPTVLPLPSLADARGVLPGLFTAVYQERLRRVDVDALAAVAQLLSTTMPAGSRFSTPDVTLTDSITWAVRQASRYPRGG
ncbi:hypothetical protein [Streptomyces parvulus]|uniref:NYN domain-containing protein n=1 Tax=Streptomyces parvulus TaxID=146923 RepID=A0ABV5D9C3_9ACTN